MKRVLLIMPNFFDYPKEITMELKKIGYQVDCFDDRPSTNGFVKAIIRIKKDLIGWYIDRYFKKIMKCIQGKKYDIVFLISGQSLSFSKDMILQIKKEQPQAKYVLYQWDSLKNFPYIKHIEPLFEKCYSFDKKDTEENEKLQFLPLFYTERYAEIGKLENGIYKYDFLFIGTAHPQKYMFINSIAQQLKEIYQKQFIYYFFPSRLVYFYRKFLNPELKNASYSEFHFEPLTGKVLEDIYIESRCILDSAQAGQTGLTIRAIEALGAKKKLITTNADVVNYDFYREENIYVYKGKIDYNSVFFKKPYMEIKSDIYKKYSLKNWLLTMLD